MKIFKRIILWGVIAFFLWVGVQAASYYYWIWRGWNDADFSDDIDKYMEKFSSDQLYKKVASVTLMVIDPYRDSAWGILIKRKEKRVVPILIKELGSWHRDVRVGAIRALGDIGDERAIEPLMEIVKKGKIDYGYNKGPIPDYLEALMALAKMKYEPAYKYALDFVTTEQEPNNLRGYGIIMLGYFEKPEALPILRKIASEKDLPWYRQKNVEEAIQRIESAQKAANK